jgi:small ligand-binding sensory domain FIST
VKVVWIVAKILPLLAGAFALLMLGLLLHRVDVDLTPLMGKCGTAVMALTEELEASKQVTVDVDAGVSYEVTQMRKPTPLIFKILKGVGIGLGAAAKL